MRGAFSFSLSAFVLSFGLPYQFNRSRTEPLSAGPIPSRLHRSFSNGISARRLQHTQMVLMQQHINAAILAKLREVIDIPSGVTNMTLRLARNALPVIEIEACILELKEEDSERAD